MHVPPPRPLKIDRAALLRDVRARLADRLPAYAEGEPDPTDPGWLLLGEAAWMVELLTEQLDRAPLSALQHMVRLMGGHLKPATPALVAVALATDSSGRLEAPRDQPDLTRLHSRSDERAGPMEFVLADGGLWLHQARLGPLARLEGGALHLAGSPWVQEGFQELGAWCRASERCAIFDDERCLFTLTVANPEPIAAALKTAVAEIEKLRLGWLKLEVLAPGGEKVALSARIDLSQVFKRGAEAGPWVGGDVEGDWRALPTLAWTPTVLIAADPRLPSELQGAPPALHPSGEGLRVADVPEGYPLDQLLVRAPIPTPRAVYDAIWSLVAHANTELQAFRPTISRGFGPNAERDTSTWVRSAIGSGQWPQLARRGERAAAPVMLTQPAEAGAALRVCLVTPAGREPVEVEAWTWGGDGRMARAEVGCSWRVGGTGGPAGTPEGEAQVHAYDVALAAGDRGALLVAGGPVLGFFLNGGLAVNAPAVRDGRVWTVQRNVPEPVSLLFQDLVTAEVIEATLGQPIGPETRARLSALSLGRLSVEHADGRRDAIEDHRGVGVDPTEGRLTLNAPDPQGRLSPVRAGARVRLDWYRRTDGATGRVRAGAIRQVSQHPGAGVAVRRVFNPLGAALGTDRERSEDAVERLFGPGEAIPTLPADFERLARQTLGPRADGWLIRCWTYAERTLLPHALWPMHAPPPQAPDAETAALRIALRDAGPDRVLFAVGLPEGELSDADLSWARATLDHRLRQLQDRLPCVRGAVVTRCWALRYSPEPGAPTLGTTPVYATDQLRGSLTDARGRSTLVPAHTLLLNAAIVGQLRQP